MIAMTENAASRTDRQGWIVPVYLAVALVIGGASTPTSSWSFALQLISILCLAYGVATLPRAGNKLDTGGLEWPVFAFLALILCHLVPLPPSIWQALPGRSAIAEGQALAGIGTSWLPLSLDPRGTVHAALAAIPAACLLALVLRRQSIPTAWAARTIVGASVVSVLVAVAQVQGGSDSLLYIHAVTNRDLGVGFFANANHLATLLLIAIPLAAVLAAEHAAAGRNRHGCRFAIGATFGFAAIAGAGIYFTASVAGALLLIPTAIASLLIFVHRPRLIAAALLATAAAVLCAVAAWIGGALPFLSTSLGSGALDRFQIARNTIAGIWHYWPVGSGLGAFLDAYPSFEDPAAVTVTYVNHAHNDYLELVFETGLVGVVLICLFLGWWLTRTIRAWGGDGEQHDQAGWAKAASIVTGIILAHSLVDYPLRTPALLLCFLFCCVLLETFTARQARRLQPLPAG